MNVHRLPSLSLILAFGGLAAAPQVPTVKAVGTPFPAAALTKPKVLYPNLGRAELLVPGKTHGTFHLTALVKPKGKVVLRWANTHGEMPTEGVTVWRLKVGDRDTAWKELNKKEPVAFFRGPRVKDRLKAMRPEARDAVMSLFHSDLQHDPATRLRLTGRPAGSVSRSKDLTPDKVAEQYRTLRTQGRLAKHDLQLLTAKADADPTAADLFGLGYEDEPGKGRWKYKITVKLPEGGTAEAVCAKEVDPSVPTPVPPAINLTTKSGNGSVLLNWEAPPSDVVAGYNLYRGESDKGPWRRVNDSPVKLVTLETEDPETVLRRESATQAALEKELKRSSGQAITPGRIAELRLQAQDSVASAGLPALSPAVTAKVKEGVAAGRLRAGGPSKPLSAFTDDQRKQGNQDLVNERSYFYRITTVDLAGGETPVETAPVVSGMPKDLEAPRVPGRPLLKAQAEALQRLQVAQSARIRDPRLRDLEQAQASKMPFKTLPLSPALGAGAGVIPSGTKPAPAAPAAYAGLSLGEIRKQRLGRMMATMPTHELKEAAAATLFPSNADGSVAPAQLAWTPSPDADLKHYEVWRAAGAGALQKVADVPAPGYTDASLEVGVAYRYAIVAVDARGNESARSDEGLVQVSDRRLKEKLAVKGLKGDPSTSVLVPGTPHRSLVRAVAKTAKGVKASGRDHLATSAAPIQLPAAVTSETPLALAAASVKPMAGAKVPKASGAPKGLAMASPMAGVKTPELAAVNAKAMTFPALTARAAAPRALAVNVMLVEPAHPKEIRVLLEWQRPLEGLPLEYAVFQAGQKFEVKSVARPEVARVNALGIHKVEVKAGPAVGPAGAPTPAAKASPAGPVVAAGGFQAMPGTTTANVHGTALGGLVTTTAGTLQVAPVRKGTRSQMVLSGGPGAFSKVNEAPVKVERFAVTFPAEVAQYGGATFYFQVQAFAWEFGRLVEGPVSQPVAVSLPDVVAPAVPGAGALAISPAGSDQFNVSVNWPEVTSRDLAGYLLERQTFATTLVDDLPKPTTPVGAPVKLTASPTAARAFMEKAAPGGYQRYTVRTIDKTGNLSEPSAPLDVFIPGEGVPGAPMGLAVVGNRLTWKAAPNALGYSVWRSFSGLEEDFEQISGLLPAEESGFTLPTQGTLHLRVVARSATGMHQTASAPIVRTAP